MEVRRLNGGEGKEKDKAQVGNTRLDQFIREKLKDERKSRKAS